MEFYGVINGAYSNHHDRLTEINTRIYERVIPSTALRPAYDVRPISSKYATMPILESRPTPTVATPFYQNFSTESVFNPGNAKAPWRGWAERVNLESSLRNQFFALQRNDRAEYVPNSSSDLYQVTIDAREIEQPNPYLFDNGATNFAPMNPNPNDLGRLTFDNSTRYQLRTLDCTFDGFCTGEGGPTPTPATNYIPRDELNNKMKENEQKRFIEEGFVGRRNPETKNNSEGGTTSSAASTEFATFIPRASASSNAREHLTMRRK
jgi:hypothetical protein